VGEGAGRRQKESASRVSKEHCVQVHVVQYDAQCLTVQILWLCDSNICVVEQRRRCVQMFVHQMVHCV